MVMIASTEASAQQERADTQTGVLVERFEALADPTRLRILALLLRADGTMDVKELVEKLGRLQQSTVSHHLRPLRQAGFLERKKKGLHSFYTVKTEVLAELEAFFGGYARRSRP